MVWAETGAERTERTEKTEKAARKPLAAPSVLLPSPLPSVLSVFSVLSDLRIELPEILRVHLLEIVLELVRLEGRIG
jgi:hypothetical protein